MFHSVGVKEQERNLSVCLFVVGHIFEERREGWTLCNQKNERERERERVRGEGDLEEGG